MLHPRILTWFWPGLARLWWRGDFFALAEAISFACLVNGLVLQSFRWPELFPQSFFYCGWPIAGIWWSYAFVRAAYAPNKTAAQTKSQEELEPLFVQAQLSYLAGHWPEAEQLLTRILTANSRDIEAGLMLVSVLRRAGFKDRAKRELERLAKFDEAQQWWMEFQQEALWLTRHDELLDETTQELESEQEQASDLISDDADMGEESPISAQPSQTVTQREVSAIVGTDRTSTQRRAA